MLSHAEEAVKMAAGRTRQDLETDRQLNLALTRLLEIIGEAANRITPPARQRCPTIPWAAMTGMRNRLIHGYDDVDFDILWDVIQHDLPPLIAQLRAALGF
jgi:uncharacterized protein with HEPN domain